MPDFSNLRDKLKSAVEQVTDFTKDAASKTADSAKALTRVTKLKLDINTEKDSIKKAYTELGRLYYETHKDNPEGDFAQLINEINLCAQNINEMEAEIEYLRTQDVKDSNIDVDFEEIVTAAEEAADAADAVVDAAVDAVEDAVDAAAEKLDISGFGSDDDAAKDDGDKPDGWL